MAARARVRRNPLHLQEGNLERSWNRGQVQRRGSSGRERIEIQQPHLTDRLQFSTHCLANIVLVYSAAYLITRRVGCQLLPHTIKAGPEQLPTQASEPCWLHQTPAAAATHVSAVGAPAAHSASGKPALQFG
jgi:hypothetical protein